MSHSLPKQGWGSPQMEGNEFHVVQASPIYHGVTRNKIDSCSDTNIEGLWMPYH